MDQPTTIHPPDPLIDEVRERRRQVFADCDNDLGKLLEAIQRVQAEHPEKIIRRRRKGITESQASTASRGDQE